MGGNSPPPSEVFRGMSVSVMMVAGALLVGAQSPSFESFHDYVIRPDEKTELFVREFGKVGAPVIVALHGGWGAEHSYLIKPLQHLAKTHRLVFYDQRGSLRSKTDLKSISPERHVADLEYLVKSIGAEKVTLVGHSMGGYLGMAYTTKNPSKVNRLLLITPVPAKFEASFWTKMDERTKSLVGKEADIVAELEKKGLTRAQNPNGFTERQDLQRRKLFFASAGGNVYRWKELWDQIPLGFFSPEAGGAAGETMPASPDFTGELKKLTVPFHVIFADQDYIDPAAQEEWLKLVPNAKGYRCKDAAHMVWWDQPKAFRQWLDQAMKDK